MLKKIATRTFLSFIFLNQIITFSFSSKAGIGDIQVGDQEKILLSYKDLEKIILEKEKEREKILKETSKRHDKLKNKAEETESGLRYYVTKSGNGIKVDENKVILTHYAVYFEDGQLLDTSVLEIAEKFNLVNIQRKNANGYKPIEAKVGPKDMMISGFKEGLKLLNIGDKAILYIPYYLAYGEMENRGIPAKSNLIFEVEIVDQL